MRNSHFLLTLLIAPGFVGCASSARLEESKVVNVPGDLTAESVGALVEGAINTTRHWSVVEGPSDSTIHATLTYKDFTKKAALSWTNREVTFMPVRDKALSEAPISIDARRFRNLRDSLLDNIKRKLTSENYRLSELHLQPGRTMNLEALKVGDSVTGAKAKLASYGAPLEEGPVKTPEGLNIGYYLASYDGHPKGVGAERVTLIFFNGAYISYMLQDRGDTELLVFDDYTNKLWEARKISFRDYVEWKKLKWFAVRNVAPDAYDEELFLYQLWQAERVDNRGSTLTEYRFLIKEKDRQIAEARANEERAEAQVASSQRAAAYQAQMVSLQQQSVDQQRRANMSLALLTAFSATYKPALPRTINCTSYKSFSGYSTTTTCY